MSLFLLMIGSSAFSNWWLGFWLDLGSQVSVPPALESTEEVAHREPHRTRRHMGSRSASQGAPPQGAEAHGLRHTIPTLKSPSMFQDEQGT